MAVFEWSRRRSELAGFSDGVAAFTVLLLGTAGLLYPYSFCIKFLEEGPP